MKNKYLKNDFQGANGNFMVYRHASQMAWALNMLLLTPCYWSHLENQHSLENKGRQSTPNFWQCDAQGLWPQIHSRKWGGNRQHSHIESRHMRAPMYWELQVGNQGHGILFPMVCFLPEPNEFCLGDEWKLSFLHSGHPPLHYSQPSQIILLIKIGEYSCVLACTPMVLVTLGKLIIPPIISFSETCTGGADQGRENNNSWNASSRVLTRQPWLTMKSISVNKKTVLRWLSTHASTRRTPMTSKQILP